MVWELVVRIPVVSFSLTRYLSRGVSLKQADRRPSPTKSSDLWMLCLMASLQQLLRLLICCLFQSFLVGFYYISVSQFSRFFFSSFFFSNSSSAITQMWTSTPAQPSALCLCLLRTVAENSCCSQPLSLYSSFHLHLAFVSKLWSLIYCSVVSLKVT